MLRNAVYAVVSTAALIVPVALTAHDDGPNPRHTGAPGDHPLGCARAGCHSLSENEDGLVNVHGGSVTATFSGGATYIPGGDPITITVRVTDPSNSRFGFQMTARPSSNLTNGQAGRFSQGPGSFVMCDSGSTGTVRPPNGNCPVVTPVEFIEHSSPATAPWTFIWRPPATDIGPVHFYVAGNAVNFDDLADSRDHVYTNAYVLNPIGACTSSAPVVDSVISAGAFGARTDFAAGSWLEIYGSNLSTTTGAWAAADFNGAAAPVLLDRVRVSVNGAPAYVGFVSPGQVNVQAPAGAPGSAQVTVTNCTQTSAAKSIAREAAAPGLLAPPGGLFVVDGKQMLAALFLDGAFVGNIPGVNSRPAKPGDLITAYGVGFGATEPAVEPGTIVSGLARLPDFAVTMGGVALSESQISYAGLAPGFVGLYQFNLIVPELPNGDHPVTMTVGGRTLAQSVFIRVQR